MKSLPMKNCYQVLDRKVLEYFSIGCVTSMELRAAEQTFLEDKLWRQLSKRWHQQVLFIKLLLHRKGYIPSIFLQEWQTMCKLLKHIEQVFFLIQLNFSIKMLSEILIELSSDLWIILKQFVLISWPAWRA